jgi:hypothetical protein
MIANDTIPTINEKRLLNNILKVMGMTLGAM